jgi:hypothetical protein
MAIGCVNVNAISAKKPLQALHIILVGYLRLMLHLISYFMPKNMFILKNVKFIMFCGQEKFC